MEKIRILHIIAGLGKGGAERALVDISNYLNKKADIEIKILSLSEGNQYEEELKEISIHFTEFELFSFKKKNENEIFKLLLEDFKPHIIHSHLFLAEFLTSYYPDPTIKYVCHGHDNMYQLENFSFSTLKHKKKLTNFLEKQRLVSRKYKNCPTYFIANSKDTDSYFRKTLPKNLKENVRLIEYGFNLERFTSDTKRELSKAKKTILINVGSFQEKKNQTFLIDVANELRNRHVDFELHFIGDGKLQPKLIAKVKELQLDDFVYFQGLINDVETWYNKSDIYVHSAHYEPFGLVFLEAMASGLPIVSLNGKGNESIVHNDKNGFLIREHNVKLFSDCVEKLIAEPETYLNMSIYAQKLAKQYDISIKTEELYQFYKSILD